jgi:CDP-diacylglycerol--glycerol-3-phosphate 3-phosphatidyltransferase
MDTSQNQAGVWTVSNFLSLLRVILVVPFIYLMHREMRQAALVLMLIAVLTDWFDGQVARWTNTVSDVGKILDPLADKLCVGSVALYLMMTGQLEVWFVAVVLVRDIVIFAGGVYARRKKNVITTSLLAGKWAVGFMAAVLAFSIIGEDVLKQKEILKQICMGISLALMGISMVQYANRFVKILKDQPI